MRPRLHLGLDYPSVRRFAPEIGRALEAIRREAEAHSRRPARLVRERAGAVTAELGMFRTSRDDAWSEDALGALLEICAFSNAQLIDGLPPLYESGVVYESERHPSEDWLVAPIVHDRGVGDCEDLAAWRVAELRRAGEDATFDVLKQDMPGELLYHIRVRREDGTVEDPSLLLGM